MDVKIFLMFIVAENTRSVNISKYSIVGSVIMAYEEIETSYICSSKRPRNSCKTVIVTQLNGARETVA